MSMKKATKFFRGVSYAPGKKMLRSYTKNTILGALGGG